MATSDNIAKTLLESGHILLEQEVTNVDAFVQQAKTFEKLVKKHDTAEANKALQSVRGRVFSKTHAVQLLDEATRFKHSLEVDVENQKKKKKDHRLREDLVKNDPRLTIKTSVTPAD